MFKCVLYNYNIGFEMRYKMSLKALTPDIWRRTCGQTDLSIPAERKDIHEYVEWNPISHVGTV